MFKTIVRLGFAALVGGFFGSIAGSLAGVVFASNSCLMFPSIYKWAGEALGAGIAVAAVLSEQPDPRACNRQDPARPAAG